MSTAPDQLAEPILVTLDAVAAFAPLGIRYAVGGSLASSLHGKPRSTDDVDLVAEIMTAHVTPLVAAWGAAYYVDDEMIRDSIRRSSCFNIIHLATMLKIDVFVAGNDALVREELSRARRHRVSDDPPRELVLASAEDIVLQKLNWYRIGGAVSDRQWRDVLGVLAVAAGSLDASYLRRWAGHLSVEDLLERALAEDAATRGR